MGYVHARADAALMRRQIRRQRGDAGPFDKGDHLRRGEDRRHLRRAAEQPGRRRDRQRLADPDRRVMPEPRLEVVERHTLAQPLYCRIVSPSLTSVRYISPSGATYTSFDWMIRGRFGRGSTIFSGAGGTKCAISFGANGSRMSNTRTPA